MNVYLMSLCGCGSPYQLLQHLDSALDAELLLTVCNSYSYTLTLQAGIEIGNLTGKENYFFHM